MSLVACAGVEKTFCEIYLEAPLVFLGQLGQLGHHNTRPLIYNNNFWRKEKGKTGHAGTSGTESGTRPKPAATSAGRPGPARGLTLSGE